MKTLYKIFNKIDQKLTKSALSYIERATKTFYPKSDFKDDDKDDDDPILFI